SIPDEETNISTDSGMTAPKFIVYQTSLTFNISMSISERTYVWAYSYFSSKTMAPNRWCWWNEIPRANAFLGAVPLEILFNGNKYRDDAEELIKMGVG